ncbi:hypothetical protein GBAR_LOCUS18603, partial [Geodia barretti]
MESLFMARSQCRLKTPPPPLPHYCPTPTLTPHQNNHKSLSTVRTHRNTAVYDDGWREGEGEGGVSDSSSQYNECWQSTSTVDSRRHGEEEEEEEEGEGGGGEEGEREREEGGTEERVDGATGQSTIAKYIERFRKAPPTPREGRRSGAGVSGNFWWERPPRGPLGSESEPSLPRSHSTPDPSKSTQTRLLPRSQQIFR